MKRFIAFVAVVAIVAAMTVGLIACDRHKEMDAVYTVNVTCANASAIQNVKVKLQSTASSFVTDEVELVDGKATFNVDAGTYKVVLSGLATGYTYEDAFVTKNVKTCTVEVESAGGGNVESKVTYTITLLLPDNTPVSGVRLQLCTIGGSDAGMCYLFETVTNAQGRATISLKAGNYELHIPNKSELPSGYTFNDSQYRVSAENNSITAKLKAI